MAFRRAVRAASILNGGSHNFTLLNACNNSERILRGLTKRRFLHTCIPLLKKEEVTIVIDKDGHEIHAKGKEGDSVLDVIVDNKIDIPGYGVCEGTLSCSTCHVKLSEGEFENIPVGASDEELDLLDMAPDVCKTSRLGCQLILSKEIQGLKVKVPSEVKDLRDVPRISL